jgi:hypothetical protein
VLGGRRIGGAVGEWYLWSIFRARSLPFSSKEIANGDGTKRRGRGRLNRTEAAAVGDCSFSFAASACFCSERRGACVNKKKS